MACCSGAPEVALDTTAVWSVYEYADASMLDDADDLGYVNDDDLDDRVLPWGAPGISANPLYNGSLGDRVDGYRPFHQRTADVTPLVTRVEPSSGTLGTTVHIFGERFDRNASLTGVAIGGTECAVKHVNGSVITCTAGNATAPGVYGVLVRSGAGLAKPIPPYTFEYVATIANVTPAEGSWEGGTLITLTGVGFAQEIKASRLMFGDREASVLSVDNDISRSEAPTAYPTFSPTFYPTPRPTISLPPTQTPTPAPTATPAPSQLPTPAPTATSAPTTPMPTPFPTYSPTPWPTPLPSPFPTYTPTSYPSRLPTPFPSTPRSATPVPTPFPSYSPTPFPTYTPTMMPTRAPTPAPVAATRRQLLGSSNDDTSAFVDALAQRWLSESSLSYSYDTDDASEYVFTSSSVLVARVPSRANASGSDGASFETIDVRRRLGSSASGGSGDDDGTLESVALRLNSNRMGGAGAGTEALHVHAGSIWYNVGAYVSNIWSPDVYGVQERLWSSSTRGVLSLFYDPVARAVAAYCHTSYMAVSDTALHVSFINSIGASDYDYLSSDWSEKASSDYILVVTTDSNFPQAFSDSLISALEECGGSSMFNTLPSYSGQWHAYQYILVGRCGAGLGSGWSADRGLEIKSDSQWAQLDLEVRHTAACSCSVSDRAIIDLAMSRAGSRIIYRVLISTENDESERFF